MDKRKGYVLLLINAGIRNSVSECKKSWQLLHYVSIFSLAAILVGSRDHRTHFWKGAIQGSFPKSLVAIGLVVSE
jgi:hypothetical protein